MSRANAGLMTDAERAAWVERVKADFAAKRGRGEIPGVVEESSASAALEELEVDHRADRGLRFDVRVSADERLRWTYAAQALDVTVSDFVRDAVNDRAVLVLTEAGMPAQLAGS